MVGTCLANWLASVRRHSMGTGCRHSRHACCAVCGAQQDGEVRVLDHSSLGLLPATLPNMRIFTRSRKYPIMPYDAFFICIDFLADFIDYDRPTCLLARNPESTFVPIAAVDNRTILHIRMAGRSIRPFVCHSKPGPASKMKPRWMKPRRRRRCAEKSAG